MGDHLRKIKAAVVQASPCFLDRDATVEKAVRLIEEAGEMGAEIIVFPEGFIPSHPVWFHFHAASSKAGRQMAADLFRNAVVVGGPETQLLADAAKRAGAWVVMGLCEKLPDTTGTMWNSAVHFSPEGRIEAVHRKLTPTGGEKLVHMGGDASSVMAPKADFGKVSSLICAENFNPLLAFSAMAQYAVVNAALWPNHFPPAGPKMRDLILTASKALAYQAGCFVLNAAGTADEDMIKMVARDPADAEWLRQEGNLGGSCIVAPSGEILAGPAGSEETILVAELDLDLVIAKHVVHDYAGHYNREDIFSVMVHPPAAQLFQTPWTPQPWQVDREPARSLPGAGEAQIEGIDFKQLARNSQEHPAEIHGIDMSNPDQ